MKCPKCQLDLDKIVERGARYRDDDDDDRDRWRSDHRGDDSRDRYYQRRRSFWEELFD